MSSDHMSVILVMIAENKAHTETSYELSVQNVSAQSYERSYERQLIIIMSSYERHTHNEQRSYECHTHNELKPHMSSAFKMSARNHMRLI